MRLPVSAADCLRQTGAEKFNKRFVKGIGKMFRTGIIAEKGIRIFNQGHDGQQIRVNEQHEPVRPALGNCFQKILFRGQTDQGDMQLVGMELNKLQEQADHLFSGPLFADPGSARVDNKIDFARPQKTGCLEQADLFLFRSRSKPQPDSWLGGADIRIQRSKGIQSTHGQMRLLRVKTGSAAADCHRMKIVEKGRVCPMMEQVAADKASAGEKGGQGISDPRTCADDKIAGVLPHCGDGLQDRAKPGGADTVQCIDIVLELEKRRIPFINQDSKPSRRQSLSDSMNERRDSDNITHQGGFNYQH
jgi:hypothetical protein